jgi:hypothetical protein
MTLPRNISANLASALTQMLKPNFIVIPGKLATASAIRNPGIFVGAYGIRPRLDAGFHRHDGKYRMTYATYFS